MWRSRQFRTLLSGKLRSRGTVCVRTGSIPHQPGCTWQGRSKFSTHQSGQQSESLRSFWGRELRIYAVLAVGTYAAVKAYNYFYQDEIPSQVRSLLCQGREAEKEENFSLAISFYSRALSIVETSPFKESSHFKVAFILAHCYDLAGLTQDAERMYAKASSVIEKRNIDKDFRDDSEEEIGLGSSDERSGAAWVRHARAVSLERQGQLAQDKKKFGKALEMYMRALELLVGDPQVLEDCWKKWSEIDEKDAAQGQESTAQDEWLMEVKGPISSRVAKDVAGVLNNIGMLYLEMGMPEQARSVFGRCLAVSRLCISPSDMDSNLQHAIDEVSSLYFDDLAD